MIALKVTSMGQVTLRKDMLQHLRVEPGGRISIDKLPDGRIEVRALTQSGRISSVFGMLQTDSGPALTIEEIDAIARQGWASNR